MPIYEYRCGKCERVFEELVLSKNEKVTCPKCGSGRVNKLFSTFAMHGTAVGTSSSCTSCSSRNCSSCKP